MRFYLLTVCKPVSRNKVCPLALESILFILHTSFIFQFHFPMHITILVLGNDVLQAFEIHLFITETWLSISHRNLVNITGHSENVDVKSRLQGNLSSQNQPFLIPVNLLYDNWALSFDPDFGVSLLATCHSEVKHALKFCVAILVLNVPFSAEPYPS